MSQPFTYTPPTYFDLGDAGRHPVTYTAFVRSEDRFGGHKATLTSAIVCVIGGSTRNDFNVTDCISNYTRSQIENEIAIAFGRQLEKSRFDDSSEVS